MRERNQYLDFVKGILVLLMLLGHSIQYASGEAFLTQEMYWNNWLMKAIYSFHMPLFIAISGYLTYSSFKKGLIWATLVKRCKKLLFPIVVWVPIVMLLAALFDGQPFSIKGVVRTFLTDFWFLWAVLFCTAGMAVIERLTKQYRGVFWIVVVMAILFSPDMLWSNAYKFMFPYFAVGYYFAKGQRTIQKLSIIKVSITTAVWIVLLLFYNRDTYIYTTGISLLGKQTPHAILLQLFIVVYRYLVGIAGCIAVLLLLFVVWRIIERNACKWKGSCVVLWFGKHSLAVYILSTYLYVYLVPAITKSAYPSIICNLLATGFVAVVCAGITMVIGKSKLLSRALIGE